MELPDPVRDAGCMRPPIAPRKTCSKTLHKVTRHDDYAWLRDENWQTVLKEPARLAPGIRAYLEAENTYTEAMTAASRPLEKTLYREIRARNATDDMSVPDADGEFAYYVRQPGKSQYPVFCRCPSDSVTFSPQTALAGEEVLFDGNHASREYDYFDIGSCTHSPDHRYIACCIDCDGSEFYTLHVIDLQSGQLHGECLRQIQPDVVWKNDSRTLVYVMLDDHHRPSYVALHDIDGAIKNDRVVYRESDPGFFVGLGKTSLNRFITISAHDHSTSEVHLLDARDNETKLHRVARRERDVEYTVDEHTDKLLIMTNADDAENYKLVTAPLDSCRRSDWQNFITPDTGTLLEDFTVKRGFLARKERRQGIPYLVVTTLDTCGRITDEHRIEFEEEVYELDIVDTFDDRSPALRFGYTSMTTPPRVFDYDVNTRERVLRKERHVPGHWPEQYRVCRLEAPAADGETVPLSLLRAKDTPLDGDIPVLLYGYGAYGYSMPAAFSPERMSLVDRGFIYAIAHVRGGMEKGYAWYRNGKLSHKRNTFSDFIAAAEHLVREKFTRPGNIAIHGASAGGMLVGAVLNQRPELFRAAVADVPFVDVLNTMCDDKLPLTPPEWAEWGNPVESEAAYHAIAAYSPYDNVAAQNYPHLLITASVADPRVTYWEPAKWAARLRALKTDDNLLLLKTNLSAGHGGASGRLDRMRETAMMYAFILERFDREPRQPARPEPANPQRQNQG